MAGRCTQTRTLTPLPAGLLHTLLTATFWMSFSLLGFSHLGQWRGINEDTKRRHQVQGWERLAPEVWNCQGVKLLCRHALLSVFAGEPWMPSLLFTITFIHLPFLPALCLSWFFSPLFEEPPSLLIHENNLACSVFMVVWPCFCYQSNESIFALYWRESAEGLTILYPQVNLSGDGALFSSTSDYEQSNAEWLIVCRGEGMPHWFMEGGWGEAAGSCALSSAQTQLRGLDSSVSMGWNAVSIATSRGDVPSLISFHRKICRAKAGNWGYVKGCGIQMQLITRKDHTSGKISFGRESFKQNIAEGCSLDHP